MPASTNPLVAIARKYLAPALVSTTVALGALAIMSHAGVHAAAVSAAPLDEHSVAALTSLDQAMEALAARVTPAVVNIAVTSTPSAEEAEEQGGGQMQGIPPGLQQFFGPGGPFSGMGGGGRVQVGS